MSTVILWILFNIFVLGMLFLDLFLFHRTSEEIKFKDALFWTIFWIMSAFAFCLGIWWFKDSTQALSFLAGYLIEKSLSVDNLFVFLMIFQYFSVPSRYLHSVLFWGMIGALVLRALFIFLGIILISYFEWVAYIFGAFLIFAGIKIAWKEEQQIDPEKNIFLVLLHKILPVTRDYVNGFFIIIRDGRYWATPLLAVLILIETTDLLFAIDSVPAILAITTDPFIVYTSNVFAILGLRSLYFVVSDMMVTFHYLKYGLAVLLVFIGVKMLLKHFIVIPIGVSLGFIAIVLVVSIITSLLIAPPPKL